MELSIDLETFSGTDIKSRGMYRYFADPDFQILLFCFKYDWMERPVLIDLTRGEKLPGNVYADLTNPAVIKTAHNAPFEIGAIERHYGIKLDNSQWRCTLVKCAMLGYPLPLEQAALAMKLPDGKDRAGKALIQFFCVYQKPDKKHSTRWRNIPSEHVNKWEAFRGYCIQDVVVEEAIKQKISFFEFPAIEMKFWQIDQKINRRGIYVDLDFVSSAVILDKERSRVLTDEAVKLSGISNPNSVPQLKKWLKEELDLEEDIKKLGKDQIPSYIAMAEGDSRITRILEIRQQLGKSSIKKYHATERMTGIDNRARGTFQFYGAMRTGRFAGRGIQMQNLTKHKISKTELEYVRRWIKNRDNEALDLYCSLTGNNVASLLSQAIRTSFIPAPGNKLIINDFSAIEARVVAWLANETWRLNIFTKGGDIYRESAARAFNVPLEKVTPEQRQQGKVLELSMGYQGGEHAIITMDRDGKIPAYLREPLKLSWRDASPNIVNLWYDLQNKAIEAVTTGRRTYSVKGIEFFMYKEYMFVKLPSGRHLSYVRPKMAVNRFGNLGLTYEGIDNTPGKGNKGWCVLDTYGGKLLENITQAISRDLLREKMFLIEDASYPIVLHVHDEIVSEVNKNRDCLGHIDRLMALPVDWAPGLPLKGDGYESLFYQKD